MLPKFPLKAEAFEAARVITRVATPENDLSRFEVSAETPHTLDVSAETPRTFNVSAETPRTFEFPRRRHAP